VIVIAHRLSTIRHADQIIVMSHGEIVERGTHDELIRKDHGQYAKMWSMQLNAAMSGSSTLSSTAEERDISPIPLEVEDQV
jgi:ABC-type transport system involved in cytochrome bd biosynthesis fused ATPase/permease subunit